MRNRYKKTVRKDTNPNHYDVVAKDKLHLFIKMTEYLAIRLGSHNKAWLAIGLAAEFKSKLINRDLLSVRNGKKILAAYKLEKTKEKGELDGYNLRT